MSTAEAMDALEKTRAEMVDLARLGRVPFKDVERWVTRIDAVLDVLLRTKEGK